jgi:putative transposase
MRRKLFDSENHAYFVTFSCYRRRKILDHDRAKQIVIHYLVAQLNSQSGTCTGFVIMPDHVHAIIHFQKAGLLSIFMNQWKRRSSMQLKKFFRTHLVQYSLKIDLDGPMWQPKYYVFNIYSKSKIKEKLAYMHANPVRAGLVSHAENWIFGSARWYLLGKSVGVPIAPPQ